MGKILGYCPICKHKCIYDCEFYDDENEACLFVQALEKYVDKLKVNNTVNTIAENYLDTCKGTTLEERIVYYD